MKMNKNSDPQFPCILYVLKKIQLEKTTQEIIWTKCHVLKVSPGDSCKGVRVQNI